MKPLRVSITERPYDIAISRWDLSASAQTLRRYAREDRIFIITNPLIKRLYQKRLETLFNRGKQLLPHWLTLPDGERYKNLSTCERLLTRLSVRRATRASLILALGGGVVGDVAGFVAATYMRGIDFIQMPTTLLAQVDSAVGGKTGVDLVTGKNLVGAFYQPRAVLIHTDFLKTLQRRELACGLAEVVKYGAIRDAALFALLEKRAPDILALQPKVIATIIRRSCAIKAGVVGRDEKEAGERAVLNFGHTLGHAIEMLSGFSRIQHGEAVAMGMVFAARLSCRLGHCREDLSERVAALLRRLGLPTQMPRYPARRYAAAIRKDKKSTKSGIKFILLARLGRAEPVSLPVKEIVRWL
jgi:3-dehydroquinate synthase